MEYWYQYNQRHSWRSWEKEGSSGKRTITLMQSPAGSYWTINTNGCKEESVAVQHYRGVWYHRANFSCVFWVTDDCVFQLSITGEDAQRMDILAMANALVKVDVDLNRDAVR